MFRVRATISSYTASCFSRKDDRGSPGAWRCFPMYPSTSTATARAATRGSLWRKATSTTFNFPTPYTVRFFPNARRDAWRGVVAEGGDAARSG